MLVYHIPYDVLLSGAKCEGKPLKNAILSISHYKVTSKNGRGMCQGFPFEFRPEIFFGDLGHLWATFGRTIGIFHKTFVFLNIPTACHFFAINSHRCFK